MENHQHNSILQQLKMNKSSFGKSLRYVRESKGVSIRSLARTVGKTPTYISDIENGYNKAPKVKLVEEFMNALSLNDSDAELRDYLYDLAAEERGEVADDIRDYILEQEELRLAIRLAKSRNQGTELWRECVEKLRK